MRIQSVKVRLHNNSGYCPALSFTKSKADSASALVCGAEKNKQLRIVAPHTLPY